MTFIPVLLMLAAILTPAPLAGPAHATASVGQGVRTPTCSDTYPYGCSTKQMWRQARKHRRAWLRHHRFGGDQDLLSGLSPRRRHTVKSAMRLEVRQVLRTKRRRWQRRHHGVAASAWTTHWRGHQHTVRGFPYRHYVNSWVGQGFKAPSCLGRDPRIGKHNYATGWCSGAPSGWAYWSNLANYMGSPGAQTDLPCKKEVVTWAAGGAVATGWASIWTGPLGVGAGALVGGTGGVLGGIATCATGKLGDLAGWW